MRLIRTFLIIILITDPKPLLNAVEVSVNEMYSKLYATNQPINEDDIELIRRFQSAVTEWNTKTSEVVRGYTQIISGKITPEQFVVNYTDTINKLPIIINKMRMSAYGMKNPDVSKWNTGFFEIHKEMAALYLNFKIALEMGDYTEADNTIATLRNVGERKAKYAGEYANRLRILCGDKYFDRIVGGEMERQSKIINK
jgi:hypothetical protein